MPFYIGESTETLGQEYIRALQQPPPPPPQLGESATVTVRQKQAFHNKYTPSRTPSKTQLKMARGLFREES